MSLTAPNPPTLPGDGVKRSAGRGAPSVNRAAAGAWTSWLRGVIDATQQGQGSPETTAGASKATEVR